MKKYLFFILSLVFFSFTADQHKSIYTIPRYAYSVVAGDIDSDGDNDIVAGHNYTPATGWSGVSILQNNDNSNFQLYDSVFLFGWQPDIQLANLDDDEKLEIIAKYEDFENENEYLAIINNFNLSDISYYSLNTFEGVDEIAIGDINGDNYLDIVISSNSGSFWGVLYNNGQGSFSIPEYYDIEGYYPSDISCGDLNGDNRDDIIICGTHVEIYFSSDEGFDKLVLETNASEDEAIIVDFDNDGDNDILTYWGHVSFGSQTFYENIEDSLIVKLNKKILSFGFDDVNIADYNNDTYQDLLFGTSDNTGYYLYQNQGNFQLADSQFIAMPCSNPVEIRRKSCSADMDGNGYMDIVTINILHKPLSNNLEIRYNDGEGNFVENPVSGINEFEDYNQVSVSAYPNPFVEQINFEFVINQAAQVELSVFDISGQQVFNTSKQKLVQGKQRLTWDGNMHNGCASKPGIYFAEILINDKVSKSVQIVKTE